MGTQDDFDPLEEGERQIEKLEANEKLTETVRQLQARQEAFRDIADRFYMLWWNLPGMTLRQVDQDVQDMFRMYMDLAPSLGVSRNGIPELRECCGRTRTPFRSDGLAIQGGALLDPQKTISGAQGVVSPFYEPKLGWCPGDIIRRVTRFFGAKPCERCDRRRRAINAFFRCGGK